MDTDQAKTRLSELESALDAAPLAEFAAFDTPHGPLRVFVSERLRKKAKKARVWKSPHMLVTLKNAAYGLDPDATRSRGGSDGIFKLDRTFKPANSMMMKLFNQFLDKPDALVHTIERDAGQTREHWMAVRLVSHHMRLLGVLIKTSPERLVLVDIDAEKGG